MDSDTLLRNLALVEAVVADRLAEYLDPSGPPVRPLDDYGIDGAEFADLHAGLELTPEEHLLVLLALVPHVRPELLGRLIGLCLPEGGDLPEFGGVRAEHHRGVLPTGETAQFVLAGDDLARRLDVQRLLSSEHWFAPAPRAVARCRCARASR